MAATTSSGKKRKVSAPAIFTVGNNRSSVNGAKILSRDVSKTTSAVQITPVKITNASGKTISATRTVNISTTTTITKCIRPKGSNAAPALNMNRNSESDSTAKYMERQMQGDRASPKNNFKRISSAEKRTTGRGGTEVKISFGPSRPPSSSNGNAAKSKQRDSGGSTSSGNSSTINMSQSAAAAASMAAMMGGDCSMGGVSFGDLDLEALKEKAAAAAAGQKSFRNKHGLPCTEAEMKALMSMFVEIMGMSMNSSNNNNHGDKGGGGASGSSNTNSGDSKKSSSYNSNSGSSHKNDSCPVFSFGANPMDTSSIAAMAAAATGAASAGMLPDHMAAATAGFFADGASWEALRRNYAAREDEDDEDEESFENRELTFEEVEFLLHHRKQKEEAAKLASQFASGDWESLEQVAINDHLLSSEADDRERKAAKKREKKQRRKAKLKEEAAQKAAEAAQKKREKSIVSWRSRVVSACQSNEVTKLDGLLQESPLRKLMEEQNSNKNRNKNDSNDNTTHPSTSCIIPHLEFLLPNSVAKNRAQVERGIEARLRLADYVLHTELLLAFKPLRTGRTALHTACFHGDVRFLQLLFDKVEIYEPSDGRDPLPSSFLDLTCDESGWSPLHYAAVSGSSEVLELLLAKGSNLSTLTDVTHTWRESDGVGLTPRELVQCVQACNYEEVIETHGLALQEMTNAFFNHHQERRVFLKKLERVHHRLSSIEKHGYSPLSSNDKAENNREAEANTGDGKVNQSETSARNKKKKKKKKKQNGKDAESRAGGNNTSNQHNSALDHSNAATVEEKEDPLVTALLGMGFAESQIMAAVKACGGTHRATADDLVTWILGQGETEESANEATRIPDGTDQLQQENAAYDRTRTEDSLPTNEKEQQKQQLEAVRKQEEAARRLAAKREEARRRNREWNNREQARQQKEAKAKVAQKFFNVPRPAVPLPVPKPMATPDLPVPNVSKLKGPPRQPKLTTGTSGLPIGGNKWGVPPISANPKPFPVSANQSKSIGSKPTSSAAPTPPTATEQHALPVSSFLASLDDDKTVSSFGSSRTMSVSSKEFVPIASQPSVPPPGFLSTSAAPISAATRSLVPPLSEGPMGAPFSPESRQGEIRATAKEFVPSFTIPGSVNPSASLQKDFAPLNDLVGEPQPSESHGVGFPPGILPQHGASKVGHTSSLLGPSLQSSFDNVRPMNSGAADTILSGASFVDGPKSEEPPMSIPFGFGQADSNESNDIGGSRLLNSISRNRSTGSASIWGDGQQISSLETTLQPSFFGDGTTNESDDNQKSMLWNVSTGGNSSLPNGGGQGSIW
ncbi:unnamed protein product [Pseudo-nitzschia multistriata]|uniref:UBA domain-containing protein n=1 Tax=Pseudo-nitzschia multistriata TaxID=183589 RepID=A0A448YXJ8_9STRA|nr:unnamed protein product [Pseudo-nitzschia multistriata]